VIDIHWTKFEQKSIVNFISGELPYMVEKLARADTLHEQIGSLRSYDGDAEENVD